MSGEKLEVVKEPKEVVLAPAFTPVLSDEERKQYTFKAPFLQEFSFRPNIVYYIAQNPLSPNGNLKLISTCKSLFRMSRILPVEKLTHDGASNGDCCKWKADSGVSINLKDQSFKLWVHDQISVFTDLPNLASTLCKHIYKFTLRQLTLCGQVLSIEELEILVSKGHLEIVVSCSNVIKNDDGSVTEFERVFELLCCKKMIIIFPHEQHGVGKNTTNKIVETLSSNRVSDKLDIWLTEIPENFDLCLFSKFLKANMTAKQHSIGLSFAGKVSDDYKNQLHQFCNDIIQIPGIYAYPIPIIAFPDENNEA